MITYEEAKKKAIKELKGYEVPTVVLEYQDAWYFYNEQDAKDGKEDVGIVIMKKTGEAVPFAFYITETSNTASPTKRSVN